MPIRKVVEGCCLTGINACGVLVQVKDNKIAKGYGWREVDINILTEDQHFDPQVGSAPLKGLLCKVSKAEG